MGKDYRKEKGVYIPNWYEKKHFEEFSDREFTSKQFNELKKILATSDMAGEVSDLMTTYLSWAIRILDQK